MLFAFKYTAPPITHYKKAKNPIEYIIYDAKEISIEYLDEEYNKQWV